MSNFSTLTFAAAVSVSGSRGSGGSGGSITVDSALSTTSTNPVQNKVITSQINSILATQNLIDTVATYSALELYDTSSLSSGNKILVTADETHDGKFAVYQWTGSAWTFVSNFGNTDFFDHNVPRLVPKNITSYVTDGSLWDRIAGTNGYTLHEDIFVGDYIKMSRAISAYEQTQTYQATGSNYVTIAGIDTLQGNGDLIDMAYEHLVMVPGMGFGGTQHFGRSRMNSSNTTVGGYVASEMNTTTLGAVATAGSTDSTATINQQLYAEFGTHLKTTREFLTNRINSSGYNRFGSATGCSNNWTWQSCQAVLMSEVECYGSTVWSSSGFDTGNANRQLPLFKCSKYAQNNRSAYYWLKDIASSSYFCRSTNGGDSGYHYASLANIYVRPRFVIA